VLLVTQQQVVLLVTRKQVVLLVTQQQVVLLVVRQQVMLLITEQQVVLLVNRQQAVLLVTQQYALAQDVIILQFSRAPVLQRTPPQTSLSVSHNNTTSTRFRRNERGCLLVKAV
jgi:hypothetical protein